MHIKYTSNLKSKPYLKWLIDDVDPLTINVNLKQYYSRIFILVYHTLRSVQASYQINIVQLYGSLLSKVKGFGLTWIEMSYLFQFKLFQQAGFHYSSSSLWSKLSMRSSLTHFNKLQGPLRCASSFHCLGGVVHSRNTTKCILQATSVHSVAYLSDAHSSLRTICCISGDMRSFKKWCFFQDVRYTNHNMAHSRTGVRNAL